MTISMTIVWLVCVAVLGIAEMLVGTFYLLVLAVAAAVAAGVSFSNGALEWQLVAFAVVALVGCSWIRRMRLTRSKEAHALQNLDEGQLVDVEAFDVKGQAKVQYRGADWTAQAVPGARRGRGVWKIVEIKGNVLMIEPVESKE